MFYGRCKGTLDTGMKGAQPRERALGRCWARHTDLSAAEPPARPLAWLGPSWMQSLCFWGTAQDKSCAALPDGRTQEGSLAFCVRYVQAVRGSASIAALRLLSPALMWAGAGTCSLAWAGVPAAGGTHVVPKPLLGAAPSTVPKPLLREAPSLNKQGKG